MDQIVDPHLNRTDLVPERSNALDQPTPPIKLLWRDRNKIRERDPWHRGRIRSGLDSFHGFFSVPLASFDDKGHDDGERDSLYQMDRNRDSRLRRSNYRQLATTSSTPPTTTSATFARRARGRSASSSPIVRSGS